MNFAAFPIPSVAEKLFRRRLKNCTLEGLGIEDGALSVPIGEGTTLGDHWIPAERW